MIPEVLYHTILTVIDYPHDASGASRTVFVLETHGTLEAAKAYAVQSLEKLNFKSDDFQSPMCVAVMRVYLTMLGSMAVVS